MIPGSVVVKPSGDTRQTLHPPASERQIEVARMLSDGCSLEEIAGALGVKAVTVKYHLHQVATRITSDLPVRARVVLWYRGAPSALLCPSNGAALRRAIIAAKRSPQRPIKK